MNDPSMDGRPDVRWIRRFENFENAVRRLEDAVTLSRTRPLTELEQQGLIQAFEFTHELAWNTLRDFLREQGGEYLFGSKDTTRAAFKAGPIRDGEIWMDMIKSGNLSSHTYDESTADRIAPAVRDSYLSACVQLRETLFSHREGKSR